MTLNMKKYDGLDIVEILSVLGSIGGSIASLVSQQVVFASIPLSLSVTLNLVNRRRLLDAINQNNQTAVAQLTQENVATQAKLGTLSEQLDQTNQRHQTAVAQLTQENVATQAKLGTLSEQLAAEVQRLTTDLGQGTSKVQDYTRLLRKGQTKVAKLVGCLREIETCTQTIRINPNYAQAYYNRGLTYQRLGNQEGAIGDYSEAIRINPTYAKAYHSRGIIRAELGNKKGAVEDLREAAKLFFEQGDIANYQTARDLSKKFHELDSQTRNDTPKEVAVEYLFS